MLTTPRALEAPCPDATASEHPPVLREVPISGTSSLRLRDTVFHMGTGLCLP